jgi:hypothetical protein
MSLCRLSEDSDVYVYEADRMYVCHFCTFNKSRWVLRYSRRAMRRHLRKHRAAGDKVPNDAFRDLAGKGRWLA